MPGQGDTLIAITSGGAPVAHQFGGGGPVVPKAVNATFDGTGAAGAFLPCLVIAGPSGAEIARIPASQVAAGASADVSWFPRVGGAASSAAGAGIEFTANGVYGASNTGDALRVTSTIGPTLFNDPDFFTFEVVGSDTVLVLDKLDVLMTSDRNLVLEAKGGKLTAFSEQGDMLLRATNNNTRVSVRIPVGGTFRVQDNAGNELLRVDENGTGYHIKTGQAWVADL